MTELALVGFANSGKSTLFNLLAEAKAGVGNWSGVTVSEKSKNIELDGKPVKLTDLPGITSLTAKSEQGKDIAVTQQYLTNRPPQLIVNVVDVNQLGRELVLTTQLLELGIPMLLLLNKSDTNRRIQIDVDKLGQKLGCKVMAICANDKSQAATIRKVMAQLLDGEGATLDKAVFAAQTLSAQSYHELLVDRVRQVKDILAECTTAKVAQRGWLERLDDLVLHPVLGFPCFLAAMYLLFMFAINVGSAFIDFFDILAGHVFVTYPLHYLSEIGTPTWLLTLVEGIGSGIQTVATFIPVVACLFIGLTLLEVSGYLARAAFVVEGIMTKIGLPGKAFVPLIVGFGCTVPAVMATRVVDHEAARIKTVMMAPFMSCGARLPVYALFAAAFFPDNGQNLVFLLYLLGIVAAVGTGMLLKMTLLPSQSAHQLMELPSYQVPRLSYVTRRVYDRTKSFVTGAGKTIVIVVCCLNFVNSVGSDGSFGHQDSEQSLLSQGAKVITPLLSPMGIKQENWQAGVGIITGIFAKEVLVATFNNLYSPHSAAPEQPAAFSEIWGQATDSIINNLKDIKPEDPLGVDVGDVSDLQKAAAEQDVEVTTYSNMQNAFDGRLGAFSYLLFILLYTPCVAAMGAIRNEVGNAWAGFAAGWSFLLAYCCAALCYQIGNWHAEPVMASAVIAAVFTCLFAVYLGLLRAARKRKSIPLTVDYS